MAEEQAAGSVRVRQIQVHPTLPEEQLMLRLPPDIAGKVKKVLDKDEHDRISFSWEDETSGHMSLDLTEYPFRLCNLPCVIESHKTFDKKNNIKIADISQMLVVYMTEEEATQAETLLQDGITPPTRDIRRKRFRQKEPGLAIELPPLEQKLLNLVGDEDIMSITVVDDPGADVEDGVFIDADTLAADDLTEDDSSEGDSDRDGDSLGDSADSGKEDAIGEDDGLSDVSDLMNELEAEFEDDDDKGRADGDQAMDVDVDVVDDDEGDVSTGNPLTDALAMRKRELEQQLAAEQASKNAIEAKIAEQESRAQSEVNDILKLRFSERAMGMKATELTPVVNKISKLQQELTSLQTAASSVPGADTQAAQAGAAPTAMATDQGQAPAPAAPVVEEEEEEEEIMLLPDDDITALQQG